MTGTIASWFGKVVDFFELKKLPSAFAMLLSTLVVAYVVIFRDLTDETTVKAIALVIGWQAAQVGFYKVRRGLRDE